MFSAIGGVVTVDGEPVDRDRLRAAEVVLSSVPGRDLERQEAPGVALLQAGPVGVDRIAHSVRGEGREPDGWIAVADADLWEPRRSGTEAREHLLAAFRSHGLGGIAGTVGDFSLGVWQESRRRLVLARDVVGLRPLLFAETPGRLTFASSLRLLVALLGGAPGLNLALLREYLLDEPANWPRQTVYSGIHRLLPGQALEWCEGSVRVSRYDALRPAAIATPTSEATWVEAFRELLDDALSARMSVAEVPAILGGGGLDSSVLAASAADLVREDRVSAEWRLAAMRFPGFEAADETSYLRKLEESFAADHVLPFEFDSRACSPLRGAGGKPEPELGPTSNLLGVLAPRLVDSGCSHVLLGEGGDSLFSTNFYLHLDLLLSMPLRRIPSELGHFAAARRSTVSVALLYGVARRVLPGRVYSALSSLRGGGVRNEIPPWMAAAGGPGLRSAAAFPLSVPTGLKRPAVSAYREAFSASMVARYAEVQRIFADAGLGMAFPYLDRRVVELTLCMPVSLRARRGVTRRLLREVAPASLPSEIRQRRTKADLTAPAYRWLVEERAAIGDLFSKSRAEDLGLLRAQPLLRYLQSLRASRLPLYERTFRLAQRAVALEAWLQSLGPSTPGEVS